jgi:hypothetical protein
MAKPMIQAATNMRILAIVQMVVNLDPSKSVFSVHGIL